MCLCRNKHMLGKAGPPEHLAAFFSQRLYPRLAEFQIRKLRRPVFESGSRHSTTCIGQESLFAMHPLTRLRCHSQPVFFPTLWCTWPDTAVSSKVVSSHYASLLIRYQPPSLNNNARHRIAGEQKGLLFDIETHIDPSIILSCVAASHQARQSRLVIDRSLAGLQSTLSCRPIEP
jgi:hypothetical protein